MELILDSNLIKRNEGKGDQGQCQGHILNPDQDHLPNRDPDPIQEPEMEQVRFHPHPYLYQDHHHHPGTVVDRHTPDPEANPGQGQSHDHQSLLLMSLEGVKGKQEGHHWKKLILVRQPAWQRRVW